MRIKYCAGLIAALCVLATIAEAQTTVRSNGSGGGKWDSTATWQGGIIPAPMDSVVITAGDSVAVSDSAKDSCASVTVASGGKLAVLSPADTLVVERVLTLEANSTYYDSSYSGTLPGSTRVIDNASTVVFRTSSIGGPGCLEFGNVVMQRGAGATAGGPLIIHGDLTLANAANGNTLKGVDKGTKGYISHHVYGNVNIIKGTLSCVDVGSDTTIGCEWNVDGDVRLTPANPIDARIGPLSSASAVGIGIINIKGNLIMNGGRLQAGSSSTLATGTGIINLYGNFTLTGGAWVTTNTKGPFSFNFVGSGIQTVRLDSSFTMKAKVYDTVAATSHVIFDLGARRWNSTDTTGGLEGGSFLVLGTLEMKDSSRLTGTGAFTLAPGATLKSGSNRGITALPDSVGSIQVSGGRTFPSNARYEYTADIDQVTGSGLPASVSKLTITNTVGVKLSGPLTVTDSLKVTGGSFDLNGNTLMLGPSGTLAETPGHTCVGVVQATRNVAQSLSEPFGGIGLTVAAAGAAPGATTVTRTTGSVLTDAGGSSIARYFDVSPAVNTGLNAALTLAYDSTELSGQDIFSMRLWKSTDAGTSWLYQLASNNWSVHQLIAAGLNSIAPLWTAADNAHALGARPFEYYTNNDWNMISVPVTMPDYRKSVLYPMAKSGAFAYNGGYKGVDTLMNTAGYWLKFAKVETVVYVGTNRFLDTFRVKEGWNMIGSISNEVLIGTIVQSPLNIVKSNYFGYNGSGYFLADTIKPGRGYWVKTVGTGGAGQLILTATPAGATGQVRAAHALLGELNQLTIADAKGGRQVLYFGENEDPAVDVSFYEMPPAGPEVSFDARFSSGRFLETYGRASCAREYPIALRSEFYPVTISWMVRTDQAVLTVGGLEHRLSGEGSLTVKSPESPVVLSIGAGQLIPHEFSLGANYPNPFNPSTRFSVGLPKASLIEVAVYDILGRNVRTLLKEEMPAGFHTIEWNGLGRDNSAAPSGVYFLRMVAEKFTGVQKIVLMK